jgi:hypothetical protein
MKKEMSIGRELNVSLLSTNNLTGRMNGSVTLYANSSIGLSSESGSHESMALKNINIRTTDKSTSIMPVKRYSKTYAKLFTYNL